MNWPSYAAGLFTLPCLALAYLLVVGVLKARTNAEVRKGLWALAFLAALVLFGVVVGLWASRWW